MDVDEDVMTDDTVTPRSGVVKDEPCDSRSRKSSSLKVKSETGSVTPSKMKRNRILFSHVTSVKDEALGTFTQIKDSIYQYEDLGESQQQDVMACECKPQKTGRARRDRSL